jgi:acetyl esterase/lipase
VSFLSRRVVTAALTANALRPIQGRRAGIPSFLAGWLTDELAPQLLGATVLDTVVAWRRGRATPAGLLVAGATAAGLAVLVRQSLRVGDVAEEALVDGLGVDYVEQLDEAPTPAELATPWRQVARPFRFGEPGVRLEKDIAYSQYGRRGHLDLYLPDIDDLAGAPVLLQVHGGAWTIGRKDQQGLPLMYRMAAKGWVCVAINYRLAPRDPWPAQIVDVKSAIAWVKEHVGAYGGDPDYIAITGGSAGGHLTALAALTPGDPEFQPGFEQADTSVQAAVPFYGIYDFAGATGLTTAVGMRDAFLGPRILQSRFDDDATPFERASPLLRITGEAPDFFVLHGTHDTLADVEQARAFVGRLRAVSPNRVVYAELPGAQHAFDTFHSIRGAHVVRAVDRFLTWSWDSHRRRGHLSTPTSSEDAVPA